MIIYAADDRPAALDVLISAIREARPDAEVYGFHSGTELLEAAEKKPCEVAFLDIDMPVIGGVDTGRRLKLMNPNVNIIFATGYDDYMKEAFDIHASGYLMKPITAEKVDEELRNLRSTAVSSNKKVQIHCFGNFEVYIDGKLVDFHYSKAKEMLAYIVDARSVCTNAQIAAALWESEVTGSYIRTVRKDLLDIFKARGADDVFIQQRGGLGINEDKVSCDFYDWIDGKPEAINAYWGKYMSQYGWAELTNERLDMRDRKNWRV